METRNVAVFILTHGRADNVKTYNTLRKSGYTGEIYVVIDDEDDQEDRYRALYGDHVMQFCKEDYLRKSMCINPDKPRKVILYARNACFDIARKLGITHFVEMDDDYASFNYRYAEGASLRSKQIRDLDAVFDAVFDFMEASGALTVAFAQGGDMLGGVKDTKWKARLARKAMNSFFCRTDMPIGFVGSINEDVNTYVKKGNIGAKIFSVMKLTLNQAETQSNAGGMTETYLDRGTYAKSFPTIMLNPSCVKLYAMGSAHKRIHHRVQWRNAVPKIINEKYMRK